MDELVANPTDRQMNGHELVSRRSEPVGIFEVESRGDRAVQTWAVQSLC